MPKPEGGEAGFLSRSERQKLQILNTQGGAVFRFVCILVEASNLPVSKVRIFLIGHFVHNIYLATRKVKGKMPFAGLKKENSCKDIVFVDKLAREKYGVNYLLFHQD